MTRKDYNAISAVIRNTTHDAAMSPNDPDVFDVMDDLVGRLCLIFTEDNGHFDAQRFRKACDPATMSRGVAS